jgi:glycosyltransferase involved in cell wall biosynthesis
MAGDRPLRVHVVIDGLGAGGAETLLADAVVGGRDAGLDFSVTALADRETNPGADRLRAAGVEPVTLGITGLLSPTDHRAMRARLEETQPDVVHAHLEYSDMFAGVAARRLGLPCVSTIHVMRWPDSPRERFKLRLQAYARRFGMQAVICVSDAAREAYRAQRWPGPEQVLTVHNGIAAEPEADAGPALRAALGIAPDALVIGTLSVLRGGKGHEELLAAVAPLRDRFGNLEVLIAGGGPEAGALAPLAEQAGARLLGHIDDPLGYAAALDILVHPSHFDAFPTALLEAGATGTPVVATRVGGIPEIVLDGETGVLVDAPPAPEALQAAIAGLLGDPARRAKMGAAARERHGREFTAAAWALRLRGVYASAQAAIRRPTR